MRLNNRRRNDRLPPIVPAHSSQLRALRANTCHARRERVQKPIGLSHFSREERAAHGKPCTSHPPLQSAHLLRVAAGRRSLQGALLRKTLTVRNAAPEAHTRLLPHRGLGLAQARRHRWPSLSESKLQLCCRGGAALKRRFREGERRFRICGGRHITCSWQQALSWWRWRALRALQRMALQRMQPPRPRLSNHQPSRYHLAQCINRMVSDSQLPHEIVN